MATPLTLYRIAAILRISGPAAARLIRSEGIPIHGKVRPRVDPEDLWAWIIERERRFTMRQRHMAEVDAAIRGRTR
jgi:hypothetical protein